MSGRTKLRLTDRSISFGAVELQASEIRDLAFWTRRPGVHHVHLQGAGPTLDFVLAGKGASATEDFRHVVEWLEQNVFASALQARLSRINLGLTVRMGRLELRAQGMRWRSMSSVDQIRWIDFDHVVVTRRDVAIVVRSKRGKLREFAQLPHNELNAVLLPMLLPAAAASFRELKAPLS
jgi:hypothetical protein